MISAEFFQPSGIFTDFRLGSSWSATCLLLLLLLLDLIAHTTYECIDAVYSYRPSSVFCRSVTLAKTAEPIEMSFELRTLVGPGNHDMY